MFKNLCLKMLIVVEEYKYIFLIIKNNFVIKNILIIKNYFG